MDAGYPRVAAGKVKTGVGVYNAVELTVDLGRANQWLVFKFRTTKQKSGQPNLLNDRCNSKVRCRLCICMFKYGLCIT
jgi:hypothetical protein